MVVLKPDDADSRFNLGFLSQHGNARAIAAFERGRDYDGLDRHGTGWRSPGSPPATMRPPLRR